VKFVLGSRTKHPLISINMADEENRYGFQYFDKPVRGPIGQDEDDDEQDEEFDVKSCAGDCCDEDCECDDCLRCSANSLRRDEEPDYSHYPAAAG
jgi:hypothetical protein